MTTTATRSRADAITTLGNAFKRTNAAVRRLKGRETHRPGTVSFAQNALLFALAEHDEVSSGELAAAADLSPATVTQMLDALVELRLVTRTRSETDRRVVTCRLTDKGREHIAERRATFEGYWNEALSSFSVAELGIAAAVLGQIATMFEGFDGTV
jgi:DNA-binding MarR family transcriptional regulator